MSSPDKHADTPLIERGTAMKVYPWRWVILAVFCACNFTNAALWICYAPISSQSAEFFDVSNSAVNMLSLVFMILYFPGSLLCSYCV